MNCLVCGFLGHRKHMVGTTQYVKTLFENPPENVSYCLPTSLKTWFQDSPHFSFLLNQEAVDASVTRYHTCIRPVTDLLKWDVSELEKIRLKPGTEVDVTFSIFKLMIPSKKPHIAYLNTDYLLTKDPASRNNFSETIHMNTPLAKLYKKTILKKIAEAKNTRKLLFRSETAMEKTLKEHPSLADKSCVHYPALELPEFVCRRDDGVVRLCFVGGDWMHKGLMLLLDVFNGLSKKYDLKLTVVTDSSFAVVEAGSNVRVFHNLPHDSVFPGIYSEADVFVLPSMRELFGVSALEAMACGLPVVMSETYAAAEIVDDGVTGYLTPYGDAKLLQERLVELIEDGSLRRRMGDAGRRKAGEKFSVEAFKAKLSQVFEECSRS
ncbi:MAG: glycosyltransferase family 4 protein [Candidatus Altiarchaeota archaeon]